MPKCGWFRIAQRTQVQPLLAQSNNTPVCFTSCRKKKKWLGWYCVSTYLQTPRKAWAGQSDQTYCMYSINKMYQFEVRVIKHVSLCHPQSLIFDYSHGKIVKNWSINMDEVEQHQPWTAIVLTCRETRYAALCAEGMQADVNHFLCNNKIYRVPSFGLHADLISSVFILFHLSLIEEFTRRQDAGFISQSVSNLAIL